MKSINSSDQMFYPSKDDLYSSPLALYSEYQKLGIELRQPDRMEHSHWHGQVEINLPFDGDVTYLINGEIVEVKKGHITIFWACVPHQLIDIGECQSMAIFNLPMHLFLSWPLQKKIINHVTHGMVICSKTDQQLTKSKVKRWQSELHGNNSDLSQLAISEIALMIKRFDLLGWDSLLIHKSNKIHPTSSSKHALFYVSQILEYISIHHNESLHIEEVAKHVKLNTNYAMGIFQKVMQMTINQYITMMRINHAKVLLTDMNSSILEVSLTVGFNSSSRFYQTFQRIVGMTPGKYRKYTQQRVNDLV